MGDKRAFERFRPLFDSAFPEKRMRPWPWTVRQFYVVAGWWLGCSLWLLFWGVLLTLISVWLGG